jgi:hypothetical protein
MLREEGKKVNETTFTGSREFITLAEGDNFSKP